KVSEPRAVATGSSAASMDRMMPSQCLVKTLLIRSLPLAVLTQPLLTRGLLPRFAYLHTSINQSLRIIIVNKPRHRLLPQTFDDSLHFISRTAAAFQTTNHFPFVVRDCELVQSANRSGEDDHDVT